MSTKIHPWLPISRVLLAITKVFAWLWTFLAIIIPMGDPAPNTTPEEMAQKGHTIAVTFLCCFGLWLFVALASRWHRRLRAHWTAENARV